MTYHPGRSSLLACWLLSVHGFWWFVSVAAVVSAIMQRFADLNAYYDTKRRVAGMESVPPDKALHPNSATPARMENPSGSVIE
jgi:hypothetical protein